LWRTVSTLEFTWECIACTCDADASWTLLVKRLSPTCGLLEIHVRHEIKQAWYTCELLFNNVVNFGMLELRQCLYLSAIDWCIHDTWEN
jgi:hypothetical protein